jgi:hypothetical protein
LLLLGGDRLFLLGGGRFGVLLLGSALFGGAEEIQGLFLGGRGCMLARGALSRGTRCGCRGVIALLCGLFLLFATQKVQNLGLLLFGISHVV